MDRYDLQSYALLAMARVPKALQPRRIPLAVPRVLLDTGGGAVSHIYKEIFVERSYEIPEPVAPGARILDAGSHIGLAALYFLHRHPQARVVSVEANPETARVLRRNLRRWAGRVRIWEQALSDHDGETSFFVTTGMGVNVNAGMTNRESTDAPVTELRVPCLDVAHLFEDGGFAFAKIDIEGGEYAVLMTDHFRPERVRSMSVEFHDIAERREAFDAVIDTLTRERGYRLRDVNRRPVSAAMLAGLTDSVVLRLEHPEVPA